jgi:hypothetical protein
MSKKRVQDNGIKTTGFSTKGKTSGFHMTCSATHKYMPNKVMVMVKGKERTLMTQHGQWGKETSKHSVCLE